MRPHTDPTSGNDRKRLLYLSLAISLFFSLLVFQFFKIQFVEQEKWSKEADKQHFFFLKEPFKRGNFFSNTSIKKGHLETALSFTIDVQKFHLFIDPNSIAPSYKEPIANMLYTVLELDPSEQTKLLAQFNKNSRNRKLAMWLDKETRDVILKWWLPYAKKNKIPRNALFFATDYQRSYPFGKLLGQVLHTIQGVKDEKTAQALPTGGLELYFNKYLKGKQGKRRLMRSPLNSIETGEVLAIPEHGANIYLTINHCLQAIAEEEIAKGVKKCKAKSGWAVMMDPYTGEIWALAQYPFFDPSEYQHFFNDPKLIDATKVKAITDANEPGSIMKPITIALALKANEELAKRNEPPLFDPKAKTESSNPHFPGRRKPLKDTHFHAFLDMDMAIQKSSNIYVARLAEKMVKRLGVEWYRERLQKDFGLGLKTGIELPAESEGLVPRPGKKHPNGALEWSASTPYSLAMGHNIQMTSLQALRAYAAFANGGYLVQPTLVRKIIKTLPDGTLEILLDNTVKERKHNFPKIVSEEHIEAVLKAMKYSTKEGGTCRRADIPGYSEAGKTGTGDKAINGVYCPQFVCSSFIGIAPANSPLFVMIVTMDEPEYGYEPGIGRKHMGGTCAAPVFREIGRRTFEYLGIPPDDPYGYPKGDPRHDSEKGDWLKEIKQLQEKYEKWNSSSSK